MENREQAEQAAAGWIAQRETGPWGERDAAAFEEWLAGSMTRRVAYYRFKKTWQEAGRLETLGAGSLPDRPLSETFDASDVSAADRSRTVRLRYAVAACVVLSVAAVLLALREEVFGINRYQTIVGGLTAVPMADGSRVTLNTDSRLRISVSERERRIDLERGEAFFDVAKDPNRPFIVVVGEKRVVAVGTQFSVRREGEDIRVSVAEGAVRFLASPTGVLLTAGSIARVASTGVLVEHRPVVEIEQKLTWRSGILTFRDTPLVDAVAELNRYNERKLFIEDPAIAATQVGGIFRSTDLDAFIHLIQDGLSLKVSQEGNRILLSAR